MEHWDKEIKNLHLALRLCGINFLPQHMETIWEVQKLVLERGDEVTIKELSEVEARIAEKYKPTGDGQ